MRTTTLPLLLLLALLGALAACGGSGSSGFDVTSLAENTVIDNALASGQCGESGALLVCPAGSAGSVRPTPGGTPNSGQEVELDLSATDAVPCAAASASAACGFVLSFDPIGFGPDADYRAAVRSLQPAGPWHVGAIVANGAAGVHLVAPVEIPPGAAEAQIAVLIFTQGDEGAAGSFETLAQTGASFAFVSAPLSVSPVP